MNVKTASTEMLHISLKKIANVNNIIMKATVPGAAFLDVKEAHEFLEELHTAYYEEFRVRPDAETYEPNIKKVGTAEIVGA